MEQESERDDIRDNAAESRYEMWIGDQVAVLEYAPGAGNQIVFVHTEVPSMLEGRGIAGKLVRCALDDARARGLEVIPDCPYVVSYLKRHPDDLDVIAPHARHRVTHPQK